VNCRIDCATKEFDGCNDCPYKQRLAENKRLREALENVRDKHNLLKGLADYGPCRCKGSELCMLHAAIDILSDIEQALKETK